MRRVLVIEDDAKTAEEISGRLRVGGYSAELAADGEEGLERGRAQIPAARPGGASNPGADDDQWQKHLLFEE